MDLTIPFTYSISDLVRLALSAAFPGEEALNGVEIQVSRATDSRHGDYQYNGAMALARVLRQPPRKVAESLVAAMPVTPLLTSVEVAGPGFINFRLSAEALAGRVAVQEACAAFGTPSLGAGKTVILDYSAPNVAKPMHIGHIRSTVIGNALDRLHRFCGYQVISDNHIGDWGTQFGLLILGYRHFLNPEAMKSAPIQELERCYVCSHARAKEDATWMDAARAELVKLQQGDPENLRDWQLFIEISMAEFERMYQRLGVRFDLVRGESFYNDALPGVLDRLHAAGLLVESDGAQVVDLEAENLGVCIVRKSDGGYNYATTDLATVLSRVESFHPSAIIYVTDERQQRHFQQFFSVARKLGVEVGLEHVWFGLMRLPDATFSTREGNVIKLEALLDEAERRALDMVQASSPEMDPVQQREVARAVGIGAVKYADLSQNPQSLVTFSWEKALALDGNSAPYLQYAHARICSVLDKFTAQCPAVDLAGFPVPTGEEMERALALKLCQFPEAVLAATTHYRPNYLADYLYELAQSYSRYYQNVPFLKAAEGVREPRLRLVRAVGTALKTGLGLLGIEAPDRI